MREEVLLDRLNVERIVVLPLDARRRPIGQPRQIEHHQSLGGRAESLVLADRNAAEQSPPGNVLLILDVDEVPLLPGGVGNDKQGVGAVPQEPGNDRPLQPEQQLVGLEPSVDDLEGVILAAAGKQQRVVGQGIGGRLAPSPPRKRLVHRLVVQFLPKQLLQRVEPAKRLQQAENHLLSLRAWHGLGLRGLGRRRLEPDCIAQSTYMVSP